jgi:hypothetical protein
MKSIVRIGVLGSLLARLLFPLTATAEPVLPELQAPPCAIIDVHEHILSRQQATRFHPAIAKHNLDIIGLVASPREVLFDVDDSRARFTDAAWNNHELLQISRQAPGRFYAFATFSPDDRQILPGLKQFIAAGGRGLKLYNGHYRFYDIFKIPLDAPHLMPVYRYCEANRIPITYRSRFLFAADMVITTDRQKDARYVEAVIRNYRHFLESATYGGILLDRYLEARGIKKTPENSVFNGLQLDRDVLRLIYYDNPKF